MNFKLKINLKRDRRKIRSIQWTHLQPCPISWDYPFNNPPVWWTVNLESSETEPHHVTALAPPKICASLRFLPAQAPWYVEVDQSYVKFGLSENGRLWRMVVRRMVASGDWSFGEKSFGDWSFGEWSFGEWPLGEWMVYHFNTTVMLYTSETIRFSRQFAIYSTVDICRVDL
jgi:hypothetical protein